MLYTKRGGKRFMFPPLLYTVIHNIRMFVINYRIFIA